MNKSNPSALWGCEPSRVASFSVASLCALRIVYRLSVLGFLFLLAPYVNAQATYTLKPTPKTVAWGYYDAKAAPVLRVKSGDTVEIQALITSAPKRLEVRKGDIDHS